MIAKQIEAPGVELTYDVNGRLDSVTTEIQACYMYPTIVAKYVLDEDRDGSNKSRLTLTLDEQVTVLSQQATDKLESYLTTIRHLRPGACELDAELQVSPDDSKDLDEAVELLKDAWDHMPTRLQGAIVKVMRESIENGEAFIKSAREHEGSV